jgi:uncharacterized protein with PQ loop repeat
MSDDYHRVAISIRLGAGLGFVYVLLFIACLLNISDIKQAAALSMTMLAAMMITGYVWIYYNLDVLDFIERLKE